jgi:hypothetical protein
MLENGSYVGYRPPSAASKKLNASNKKKSTASSRGASQRQSSKPRRSSGSSQRESYKPRRSSGGGSSNNGGGGGSGTSYSPPKAPKAPSIGSYLGTDSTYQQQVRGGKRSLADFLSEMGRRRGEAGTQYGQTTASMERDRVTQLEDLRNEFASRGLIQSGLYGEEQGNFQKKFTEQQTALSQQQAALLADLLSQEKNYRRENDLATEAAKQEALQRRAAKYKIGA